MQLKLRYFTSQKKKLVLLVWELKYLVTHEFKTFAAGVLAIDPKGRVRG